MKFAERTKMLVGADNMRRIESSTALVFGLGGVGGACAEALCRAGVGSIILVDHDTVSESNINRQIIATTHTVGMNKAQVCKERLLSINPDVRITALPVFYLSPQADEIFAHNPTMVFDCVDTITAKLSIAQECKRRGIPLVSSMGTGNRLHPEMFEIGDIGDTSGCGCPVARIMRRELKKRGIDELLVVYSKEIPRKIGSRTPASISFTPPVAGYLMASALLNQLTIDE